jgi:hypothetical protein
MKITLPKGAMMGHQYWAINQSKRSLYRWQTRLFLAIACFWGMGFSGSVAAQSGDCTNLVADSGLESGTGWSMKTKGQYAMLSNIQAHGGMKSAYLAGANQATDLLSTKVVLPSAGGQSAILDFWWKVNSEDRNDTSDQLTVQVLNGTGKIQTVLLVLGSEHASNDWQQSALDISEFVGQSIQLQFVAKTNAALVTDFFIDDVALLICSAAQ